MQGELDFGDQPDTPFVRKVMLVFYGAVDELIGAIDFSRIEEVRRELRSTEKDQQDTFIGTVERLDGEMTGSGRRSGEVILALLVDGESVRTRTSLDPEEHEKADKAHMTDGSYVQITGRLRSGRQPRLLTNVSSFEL